MSDRASAQDTVTPTSTIVDGGHHSMPSSAFPKDKDGYEETGPASTDAQVALTCLLINGERHTFYFAPGTSIQQIKRHIHGHWPKEWTESCPDNTDSLKILYQGRFLEDQQTLAGWPAMLMPPETSALDNKITTHRPYIVHLTIRRPAPSTADREAAIPLNDEPIASMDANQPPLPRAQTHYRHRSYSSLDHAYPAPQPPPAHASTTASWSAQPSTDWWSEHAATEATPSASASHHRRHSDSRAYRSQPAPPSAYPPSSSAASSSTAEEGSDGGEWTEGRSRTARAADQAKAQRIAPPVLRSITAGQSRRMSQDALPSTVVGYAAMHPMAESTFPIVERQAEPFRGFELVFVDPLDVVPPEQIDKYMRLPYPGHDECLVRYFEDNKFSMVKMKDLVPFTLDAEPYLHFSRNFPEFLEDSGVRRALRYMRTGILPRRFPWKGWRDMASGEHKLLGYGDTYRTARLAHVDDVDGDVMGGSERTEDGDQLMMDGEGGDGTRGTASTAASSTASMHSRRSMLSTNARAAAAADAGSSGHLAEKEPSTTAHHPQPAARRGRGYHRGGYARRRVEHDDHTPEKRRPYQRPPTRPPDAWDYIRSDEQGQPRAADEREALYQSGFERLSELQAEYRQLKRVTRELAKELVGRHENGGAITRARRRKLAL
ncbi:hypothetical protein SYNPS1DRAFT_28198 [Syncephalis pseudoplumigaleata]|uniref:Ubiquitin-like domain-containing protein n=1 Tax=Syncephalis pseudoplumigaleata TaxID=1712513 RepID=A0A4P9Z105_9FUNG|nr:hypothetical protein SYNPS1DRAFT_28198 [Syncephalis pseudoplumigaleata]|eukprot:RKP26094.1 hypothetical protein SYNPS1DRAFT_28198 [Syncephalis pseudoplumigaleata]